MSHSISEFVGPSIIWSLRWSWCWSGVVSDVGPLWRPIYAEIAIYLPTSHMDGIGFMSISKQRNECNWYAIKFVQIRVWPVERIQRILSYGPILHTLNCLPFLYRLLLNWNEYVVFSHNFVCGYVLFTQHRTNLLTIPLRRHPKKNHNEQWTKKH